MKLTDAIYNFLSRHSYLLPIGVAGLTIGMLLLTLLPSETLGDNKLWSYDKLGHAVLFGSWSLALGLYYQIHKAKPLKPWIVFTSGALFGLLIEILQYALPVNRQGDPADFLFDVIGCLIAVFILKVIIPEKAQQSTQAQTT
ncbi:MAG: VanZ family protein [Bacteroidota bacterium]